MVAARMLASLSIGATFSCANTPPSPFNDSLIRVTTDDGVPVTAEMVDADFASGLRVTAPTFELDFGSKAEFRLPTHLMVNQVDVLGIDDPCQGESRIGIAVSPAIQATAGGTNGTYEIAVLAAGPAMAKVRVTYQIPYTCAFNEERMTGATEFTILPHGRIVREDIEVKPSTHTLSLNGDCGCRAAADVGADKLFFSSFWAFDPIGASQIDPKGNTIDKDATDEVYQACTMYSRHAIGVAWEQRADTRARIHSNQAASHTLDFPTINDHLMLAPTPQSITSAIQISAKPLAQPLECGNVLALLADVPLTIGDRLYGATDHDGIYRDSAVHNEAFDIVAGDEAVPSGFAISVDLGGAHHAVLTRQNGTEQPAVAQRESANRFLLFFEDGLAPGERLTIEPRR